MLVKTDRMSMAHSLETRIPFLDYRLIEYMVKVHKNIKMRNLERKSILKDTIGNRLPRPVLKAPKKGFSVPLRYWFRDASFKIQFENLEHDIDYLHKNGFDEILRRNTTGRSDDGSFIWKLFVLNKIVSKPASGSTNLFNPLLNAI
jgi:asparagine synthase (glutamine-hydrolysing)